ncbi:MAG: VOC family protein [Deltaproteobacteria bacterium]|nr:VOC family protein [Deltaproteobacteria bacterium]
MANKPKAVPEGYTTVTPAIAFKGAARAIEFYKKALGAEERFRMNGPDGKTVMHAELQIGSSVVMVSDEMPDCKSAQTLGDSPVAFYVYVEDVDVAFARAVAAGGEQTMPVTDMFWGDRTGQFQDPFGYKWTVATHTRDVTPEQIEQGQREWLEQMMAQKPA